MIGIPSNIVTPLNQLDGAFNDNERPKGLLCDRGGFRVSSSADKLCAAYSLHERRDFAPIREVASTGPICALTSSRNRCLHRAKSACRSWDRRVVYSLPTVIAGRSSAAAETHEGSPTFRRRTKALYCPIRLLSPSVRRLGVVDADGDKLRQVKVRVPDEVSDTIGTSADMRDSIASPVNPPYLPSNPLSRAFMVRGDALSALLTYSAPKVLP
jgi:hypothetical protein